MKKTKIFVFCDKYLLCALGLTRTLQIFVFERRRFVPSQLAHMTDFRLWSKGRKLPGGKLIKNVIAYSPLNLFLISKAVFERQKSLYLTSQTADFCLWDAKDKYLRLSKTKVCRLPTTKYKQNSTALSGIHQSMEMVTFSESLDF